MRLFLILGITIVSLIVIINLFVELVIFIAQDYHILDQIHIYDVFESPRFAKVRDDMMKQNYTILIGDDETGIKNFIEHQANIQTLSGKAVVVKRYQSPNRSKQELLKKIKETRFYMQLALGFNRKQRTEVFFVNAENDVPLNEIKFIREKYPRDNIIIISDEDLSVNLEGFKKIKFPPIKVKEIKAAMNHFYGIGKEQAQKIFQEEDNSIERVFSHFKRRTKMEDISTEQLVEVDEIEDLNEISHEMAEKQKKKIINKLKQSKSKPQDKANKKNKR